MKLFCWRRCADEEEVREVGGSSTVCLDGADCCGCCEWEWKEDDSGNTEYSPGIFDPPTGPVVT